MKVDLAWNSDKDVSLAKEPRGERDKEQRERVRKRGSKEASLMNEGKVEIISKGTKEKRNTLIM